MVVLPEELERIHEFFGAYIRKYLPMRTSSTTDFLMVRWTAGGFYPIFRGALWSFFSLESDL